MVKERIANEDIDDVIGLAAEMMQEDDDTLALEDLRAVGAELDIPPEYLERAREELARRRAEAEAARAREAAARRKLLTYIGIGAVALVVIVVGWGWAAVSGLRTAYASVEAQRAQVANVLERQEAIREALADRPDSPDKDAELVGSENRVRVETQRYAGAAAAYNDRAGRFPASLFAPVVGLPAEVPVRLED